MIDLPNAGNPRGLRDIEFSPCADRIVFSYLDQGIRRRGEMDIAYALDVAESLADLSRRLFEAMLLADRWRPAQSFGELRRRLNHG